MSLYFLKACEIMNAGEHDVAYLIKELQEVNLCLLTLAYIGRAEGYCNFFVCLFIYYHIFSKTRNTVTSNTLLVDFKL